MPCDIACSSTRWFFLVWFARQHEAGRGDFQYAASKRAGSQQARSLTGLARSHARHALTVGYAWEQAPSSLTLLRQAGAAGRTRFHHKHPMRFTSTARVRAALNSNRVRVVSSATSGCNGGKEAKAHWASRSADAEALCGSRVQACGGAARHGVKRHSRLQSPAQAAHAGIQGCAGAPTPSNINCVNPH